MDAGGPAPECRNPFSGFGKAVPVVPFPRPDLALRFLPLSVRTRAAFLLVYPKSAGGSDGTRTTVVDNLPSSAGARHNVSGVADVAFIGDTLYALLAGADCSHGLAGTDNAVLRVNADARPP